MHCGCWVDWAELHAQLRRTKLRRAGDFSSSCIIIIMACPHAPCSDAEYAYRKVHGTRMDGRKWEVRWATKQDFKWVTTYLAPHLVRYQASTPADD